MGRKPIYLYINSTGTTKVLSSHQFLRCVLAVHGEKPLCFWLLVPKGNRSAFPSSTIMIKQPIARFQGQGTNVDLMRKEVKNVKAELVKLLSKHIEKSVEEIEADIRRPKYFSRVRQLNME